MPVELVHKAEYRYEGLWLLNAEDLEQVDKILAAGRSELLGRVDAIIKSDVENFYPPTVHDYEKKRQGRTEDLARSGVYLPSVKVGLRLEGSKQVVGESFADALHHAEVSNSRIQKVYATLKARTFLLEFEYELTSNSLRISGDPSTDEIALKHYTALKNWALERKQSWWVDVWVRNARYLAFNAVFLAVMAVLVLAPNRARSDVEAAKRLLEDGLTGAEVPPAMELLLRQQFLPAAVGLPSYVYWVIAAAAVFAIVSWNAPRAIVGIGQFKAQMKRTEWWIKFVGVSTPATAIGLVLRNFIE